MADATDTPGGQERRDEPDDAGPAAAATATGEAPRALPEIDFATFVLSLATSVLIHLGELADPGGHLALDLPQAKQTIDLLGMLQEKTRGNLDEAEEQLVSSVLYDVRVKYVDALRAAGAR